MLGVTRQTVRRWVAIGKLAGFDIGSEVRPRVRVSADVLAEFIAARELGAIST